MARFPILLGALLMLAPLAESAPVGRLDRKFDRADLNLDQQLDFTEFLGTQRRNATWVRARFSFEAADENNDEMLSRLEFQASRGGRVGGKPDALESFELADEDEDRVLDPAEFALTMNPRTAWRRVLRKFDRKDRNDDGLLSETEFVGLGLGGGGGFGGGLRRFGGFGFRGL